MNRADFRVLCMVALAVASTSLVALPLAAQQMADPNFQTVVEHPAYSSDHPRVVVDEAHSNFHTAEGRYKPLADLLRSDGYEIVRGTKNFEDSSLDGVRVLVISNAAAPDATAENSPPAFTEQECEVVREWVRGGGSLLLIADHTPFGSAAEALAKRFGVEMGKGFVFDLAHAEGGPTQLLFSRENALLGEHPLLRGRNAREEVKRVVTFTGQSLSVPEGAQALLKLSPSAYEATSRQEGRAAMQAATSGASVQEITAHAKPVGGRAQGLAMSFGKGRVVMLGEAALFSAQIIRFQQGGQQQEFKMGMNVPGNDDRQFALNVLHWLSGLLD